jgi:hypothetical protein
MRDPSYLRWPPNAVTWQYDGADLMHPESDFANLARVAASIGTVTELLSRTCRQQSAFNEKRGQEPP